MGKPCTWGRESGTSVDRRGGMQNAGNYNLTVNWQEVLESRVLGNLQAWFGEGQLEKGCATAPRWLPTPLWPGAPRSPQPPLRGGPTRWAGTDPRRGRVATRATRGGTRHDGERPWEVARHAACG